MSFFCICITTVDAFNIIFGGIMAIYTAVTILCLALMIAGSLTVVINIFRKNRADRITYIRNFKKGKGVLIYIFAIPLYWIGIVYSGQSVFLAFFATMGKMLELIGLKCDINSVKELAKNSELYEFVMYFAFILVTINAVLFAISLAGQYMWNYFGKLGFIFSKKEKIILFGNTGNNFSIYTSDETRAKMVVDEKIPSADMVGMYTKGIMYNSVNDFNEYIRLTVKYSRSSSVIAIINTGDEEKNIMLGRSFNKEVSELDDEGKYECFGNLKVFIFGIDAYESIYEDVVSESCGCMTYVNKHQRAAIDFIDKYPMSAFLTDEHIDYKTSLVKEDVDLNMILVGFGNTNRQIFLTSVANNQFITKTERGIDIKPVNYYIFDKKNELSNGETRNDKNLNHSYRRYETECRDLNKDDYLPLPAAPANYKFIPMDVNDSEFYSEIYSVIKSSKVNSTFIVISFGMDLENIDMAQKLVAKRKEWGVGNNVTIFAKVNGGYKDATLDREGCHLIANDKEVVYNINDILGDSIFKMAQMRNEIYDAEYILTSEKRKNLTDEELEGIKAKSYREWYTDKLPYQRESSIYSCLSLRSKLNLMDLDYRPVGDDGRALTEEEYMDIYAGSDRPDLDYYGVKIDGKPIIYYSLDFKASRRRNLAIHEHLRWNSFMLSKGWIPSSKADIADERKADNPQKFTNGKNNSTRRHGNLTTFDGLVEFRKIITERDKNTEEENDVIKYDYQLLDDAYWLLTSNGYKIVKRNGS